MSVHEGETKKGKAKREAWAWLNRSKGSDPVVEQIIRGLLDVVWDYEVHLLQDLRDLDAGDKSSAT